jgi:hypothetical protein
MGRCGLQEDYDSGTYAPCRLYGRVARGLCPSGGAEASMPTAVNMVLYSLEFDARPGFVAGAVVVSTLLSLATLALLLTLLRV